MGWNRLRTYALVAAVALLSTLVVVPAFGSDHEEVVDAVEFTAVDGTAKFLYGDLEPQVLTTSKNGCDIEGPAGTILSLAGDGGPPGLNDLSIGIKTSGKNANGTPCSQVDQHETLTIQPGSALTGTLFSKVQLDLEVTKDAIVKLTLSDSGDSTTDITFTLNTGANATPSDNDAPFEVFSNDPDTPAECAASTSSGPNSHANDNCIWTVEPGLDFDTIEMTIDPTSPDGTVSLEGGSDTGFTTLFFVAPDRLNCDEDKNFPPLAEGDPNYTVRPENGGVDCEKDFTYDAGEIEIEGGTSPFVELITSGDTVVVFIEKLEFEPEVIPADDLPTLLYDDDLSVLDPTAAPFCLLDPRAVGGVSELDIDDAYDSAAKANLVLPTNAAGDFTDTTCIISAEFVTTGTDEFGNPLVEATYWLYNLNDGFRTFK